MKKIFILFVVISMFMFTGSIFTVVANTDRNVFRQLSEAQLLGLAIYGEARGETFRGRVAVGSVILERVKSKRWGSIKSVILAPYQFSCFNYSDRQYYKLKNKAVKMKKEDYNDQILLENYLLAKALLDGSISTNKNISKFGVLHFKTPKVNPSWASKMFCIEIIGNHEFYAKADDEFKEKFSKSNNWFPLNSIFNYKIVSNVPRKSYVKIKTNKNKLT